MLENLTPVILTRDIPEQGLKSGDMGAIVMVYPDHKSYEVEFVGAGGSVCITLPHDVLEIVE